MNEETIKERLVLARKSKNMSQTELAKIICMSPQSVSKWESGDGLPDVVMLGKIANILDKDIAYFYGQQSNYAAAEAEKAARKCSDKKRAVLNESYGKWKSMDFSATKMQNYDFKYARFEDCDFADTDFSKNNFPYTEFIKCNLSDTNFCDCEFFRADYENCILTRTDFNHAEIIKSDFSNCQLDGVVFDSVKQKNLGLHNSNVKNTQFRGQDFKCAYFEKTTFEECIFRDCSFTSCTFKKVTFINCKADKITYNFLLACGVNSGGIEII